MANDVYAPLVTDVDPLNEVKYAAKDYPSTYDSLLRRIKIEYEEVYNDFATTAQAIMLVELMAYASKSVLWYLDRTASDCFLDTARTRAAVARLVKQIGYKMGAASASSAELTVTFPEGTTGPFVMDARWRFQGPNGFVFESYAEHQENSALAAGSSISVPVRQGDTRIVTYTSDGSRNQAYRLPNIGEDRYLAKNSVEVWVDGALWEEKDFLDFEKTNHYEVGYNDDPPVVQFGDGIAGNMPDMGAEVRIRFLVIDGKGGNVKANTITGSLDTLIVDGSEVPMTVTNVSGSTGGRDPEDYRRAKRLAPLSFAARGAAITADDYESLSNSYTDPTYGSVAVSYAFNPRTAYEDVVFNALIDSIESDLDDYVDTMSTLESNINDAASSLSDPISDIQSDLTDLETVRSDLELDVDSGIVNCDSARGNSWKAASSSRQASTSLNSIISLVSSLESYVNANSTLAGDPTTRDYILDELGKIDDSAGQGKTRSDSAASDSDASANSIDTAINDFFTPASKLIKDSAPVPTLVSIASDISSEVELISDTLTGTGGIQEQIANIVGESESFRDDDVLPILTSMHARIGELFEADCRSNYVQVPILSLDVDGNYVAPSVGLMTGLQSYLTGIKEVTQFVEVVDGSSVLIPAVIEIVLEVDKESYVESEVVSKIVSTILGMLKRRLFNSPLYLSDLYTNVKMSSGGITRFNVEITGPNLVPSVIDDKGNLVPRDDQIIVLGELSVKDGNGRVLY